MGLCSSASESAESSLAFGLTGKAVGKTFRSTRAEHRAVEGREGGSARVENTRGLFSQQRPAKLVLSTVVVWLYPVCRAVFLALCSG